MNFKSSEPCLCCGESRDKYVTSHHVYTRKAYPELAHDRRNKMPLCLEHHNMIHKKGTSYMAEKFPNIFKWLLKNDWEFDSYLNKWINPNLTNKEK